MTSQQSAPADKPADPVDRFMDLIAQGRHAEARALLDEMKVRAKYEPDSVKAITGKPPVFHKGRMKVELGPDKIWRPTPKTPKA